MRSESWKFIWQPKVSIRYFLDTVSLSPFALSSLSLCLSLSPLAWF